MLERAHPLLAAVVVAFQMLDRGQRVRRHARHFRKQQIRLLRMMLTLGELVDVEQHGAQHIKKRFGLHIARALVEHHHQRLEHRRQRSVLFQDDADSGRDHCLYSGVKSINLKSSSFSPRAQHHLDPDQSCP